MKPLQKTRKTYRAGEEVADEVSDKARKVIGNRIYVIREGLRRSASRSLSRRKIDLQVKAAVTSNVQPADKQTSNGESSISWNENRTAYCWRPTTDSDGVGWRVEQNRPPRHHVAYGGHAGEE